MGDVMPRRRTVLKAGFLAAAVPVIGAPRALAATDPSLPPHGDREPAGTRIERIAGTGVLFQYGEVVPSFDGWAHHEPTRGYQDLDGHWTFRFDPDDRGLSLGWHLPKASEAGWDRIAVPSSWDLKDGRDWGSYDGTGFGTGTPFADGFAWYRRKVRVPWSWTGRRLRLAFLAVNYRADVWVNGRFVGAHEGGHTPFALPVGDAIRPGHDAVIAVRVHRRASYTDYTTGSGPVSDPLAIPWKPVDYWPYAGITRSVWLEAVPEVTIPKVLVAAADGRLEARVVVANQDHRRFVGTVVVKPGHGAEVGIVPVNVAAGEVAVVAASLAIPGAPSWSSERPRLLRATAQLRAPGRGTIDQLSTTYGVRSVRVDGPLLKVNDAPVFLKGFNWHEESAAHGRSMTIKEYDRELGHALSTGANFLRHCVYNRHPYTYDWADRHGVFVMDDIDNMWLNTAQERVQTEQYGLSRALAAAMAWNQHNRPSVIMWCLQNESEIDAGDAPVYRAWLQDMKDAIKALDLQDRPVTWASHTSWDPAFDLADIVGFNEYFGYFYGKNEDLGPTIDAVHGNHPTKPILITENGSWSFLGNHGSETEAGTEEWHAANFRSHWEQVTARPDYVAGYLFWVLKDYKQRAGYNEEYNGISTMGLLGFDSTTRRRVYADFAAAELPEGR
jgi:beta-glucuronidase